MRFRGSGGLVFKGLGLNGRIGEKGLFLDFDYLAI
jgi:hypothetical protein